ncbi:hypothetical protein I4F81_005245 [Pyropia yezoensis]|uniref:Uncharacterized protein n=1 Tax=Pyropia yezoensis TaxID=2788 RepID=A0ACC3BYS2_PYRYE|nr:hypothetical protein I4F81_005245 [Neopyropia yezoensis]
MGCEHEASVGGAGVVDAWSVASLVGSLPRLPVLTALTLTCDLTSATSAAVAAACPALEGLTLQGNDADGAWTSWTLPTALPLLSSLEWHVSDERFDPIDRSGFALMMRGRRLRRLVLRRPGTSTPLGYMNAPCAFPFDAGLFVPAAALPVELLVVSAVPCTGTYLQRLVHGPAEVGTLRKLTLVVPDNSQPTLSPLSRLTGLINLTLEMKDPVFVSWRMGLNWTGALLDALAASPSRHSLEVLSLDNWGRGLDACVAAATPKLVALRRLTVGRVGWARAGATFVRKMPMDGEG